MTDLRFTIPNQMRRNLAASRLRREGFEVETVPSRIADPEHLLDVYNVDEKESAVEELVTTIAPGAERVALPEPPPADRRPWGF